MSENKKYFHYCRSLFCSGFVLLLAITSIFADDIYSTATTEILARDSIMNEIIIALADVDNLNRTDKIILKWLKEYPEFEYIIRINSKGKIISKVTDNKILPRDFKYIGSQKWFMAMELTGKPYFGNVIQNKELFLFWNRPVFIKSRNNRKFTGALSVKINLKKCFSSIAKKNSLKFSILYENQTIFTNLKDINSDNNIIRKMSIYGLPGLFIKYEKVNPQPVYTEVEGKKELSQQSALQSIASQNVISQSVVPKVQKKINPVNPVVDKILYNESNPNMLHYFIYSVGICLILFSLCIFFINRAIVNLTSRKI